MKTSNPPPALYEHPGWQDVPEQAYRPGGLAVTEQALSYCDLPAAAPVLDIGCGAGSTLGYLVNTRAVVGFGVDISARLLRRARQNHPGLTLGRAAGERLPFAGESMAAVISECTLSLFEADAALSEWSRVLKTGGCLVISDLYVRNEKGLSALKQLPPGSCISTAMTRQEIVEKVERCGLALEVWKDCSDRLSSFPACTLATAAGLDPFDLYIAAARAKLGYYFLVARKQ